MKEFERSEEYMTKIFLDALDRDVMLDAQVVIRHERGWNSKLKAWCPSTKTNLQFPTKLREHDGQRYIADVIKSARKGGKPFFRAYRGSIRDAKTGEVVG